MPEHFSSAETRTRLQLTSSHGSVGQMEQEAAWLWEAHGAAGPGKAWGEGWAQGAALGTAAPPQSPVSLARLFLRLVLQCQNNGVKLCSDTLRRNVAACLFGRKK